MIRPAILVVLGGAAVVLAIALNFVVSGDEDEATVKRSPPSTRVEPAVTPTTPTTPAMPATTPATTPTTPETPPKATAAVPTQEAKPKPKSPEPSFDVVRVNPRGDTVMAGRAEPKSRVAILDRGKKIGEVEADSRGEWVFVPDKPLASGSRELALESTDRKGEKRASKSNVVLVVPERIIDVASGEKTEPSVTLVVKVPRTGRGASEVLQSPLPSAPAQTLSVDVVDYDDHGLLDVSGRAPAKGKIHLYINDRFVGRTEATAKGIWQSAPKDPLAPGVYTLRADQVDEAGKVRARVEVVFARSVPLRDVQPGSLVVVERGNSLWRIARRTYGTGFRYTVIYRANKEQIKNEDLIYPGQVFTLPSIN